MLRGVASPLASAWVKCVGEPIRLVHLCLHTCTLLLRRTTLLRSGAGRGSTGSCPLLCPRYVTCRLLRMVARRSFDVPEPQLFYKDHNHHSRRDCYERAHDTEGRSREGYGCYHDHRVQRGGLVYDEGCDYGALRLLD